MCLSAGMLLREGCFFDLALLFQQDYQRERVTAREERGIESADFDEMRSPFQMQILARVKALEISDV